MIDLPCSFCNTVQSMQVLLMNNLHQVIFVSDIYPFPINWCYEYNCWQHAWEPPDIIAVLGLMDTKRKDLSPADRKMWENFNKYISESFIDGIPAAWGKIE